VNMSMCAALLCVARDAINRESSGKYCTPSQVKQHDFGITITANVLCSVAEICIVSPCKRDVFKCVNDISLCDDIASTDLAWVTSCFSNAGVKRRFD
jgi:hypothetical protein